MNSLTRRNFLKYSGGLLLTALSSPVLVACQTTAAASTALVTPAPLGGPVREFSLTAAVSPIDLGTGSFQAWTYNGLPVGPEIRVTEGDLLRVMLTNNLPEPTTIHWHGLPVPNEMDGVPNMPLPAVLPGETFTYEFVARPSGTYWYHSHVGYQLDQGLAGPLIVEPASELGAYDREYTLLLDDWVTVDNGGPAATRRQSGGMMSGMMGGGMMGGSRQASAGPLTEPVYQAFTINGQVAKSLSPFTVKQGERVRLRLVNAAAATIFGLRLAGHSLNVTHADGRPVEPLPVDAVWLGMGERYDLEFTADNPGRWSLYAMASNVPDPVDLATFVYSGVTGTENSGDSLPRTLRWNEYGRLAGRPEESGPSLTGSAADKTFDLVLSGGMMSPFWTINGKIFPDTDDLVVRLGERVRLNYFNRSPMPHPMHLHGHFFQVLGSPGLWKDTVVVPGHMGQAGIEFMADNPGEWIHHCHNLYHMEAGMMNKVRIG